MIRWLLLLLLAGCVSSPPDTTPERSAVVAQALARWDNHVQSGQATIEEDREVGFAVTRYNRAVTNPEYSEKEVEEMTLQLLALIKHHLAPLTP